jgi:two-component system CheB/CheR fusion protein
MTDQAGSNFLVVGVGASAGGLEALERLFAAAPADIGMAFVVIQHLSPDFESHMDELLGRQTVLPIQLVSDGVQVEPGAIYLIPPRKEMIISGGRLLLTDKEDVRGFSLPIDHFFRSLAHDMGRRAVAVVLSGAGSDGSRGLREVHEAGGLVISQTPDTARFQGMPLAAKQTGLVDLFLAPEEIPTALLQHARDPQRQAAFEAREGSISSSMERILRLLRADYGIEFSLYKPSTVLRRIERRLQLTNQPDVDEYARLLQSSPEELNALYRDLLIGVTRFFRDREAFDRLDQEIIPKLLLRVPPDQEIRVWVAGCATGEEAYSIAMLLHEHLEAARRPLSVRLFATDVHRASLDTASAGCYDDEALSDISPARRQRYFARDGGRWRIVKELRQLVVFARHNVITDAPFTRLDLVSCRNLLIYLQPPVQRKVLSLFHFALKAQGTLLLGPSETPGDLDGEFDAIDAHWKIYSKRRDSHIADVRLPLSALPSMSTMPSERGFATGTRPVAAPQLLSVYDQILDRVMPPSLLVDEHYQLVHAFGGAERLLRLKSGRPSMNVLDLLEDNLKTAVLGALQHAQKTQGPVKYGGVPVRSPGSPDGGHDEYQVSVEPLHDGRTATRHYLIRLVSQGPVQPPGETAAEEEPAGPQRGRGRDKEKPRDYVTALETELRFTKESLQATIEESEAANEELQSTNEELVASNEELQSTNEELHSVNEELYTVNVEHQRKITQLSELTDDLDNLLHSIEIGVLFLDERLCVRKFTAHMARVFRLLPQDVGRRFDSFAHTIQHPRLEADIEEVLRSRQPIEREVTSREGTIYLMRVLPYRAAAPKGGVVLTLIDVTTSKQREAYVRRLSAIVETSTDAILAKDLEGRIFAWNQGAERLYGYTAAEAIGRHSSMLVPADRKQEIEELIARVGRGVPVEPFETTRLCKDGTLVDVWMTVSPLYDEHEHVIGVGSIARDVTQRKRDEAEVRRSLRMRDDFMAMLSHELRNPLAAVTNACSLLRGPDADPRLRNSALGVLDRQVRHMARLLDDLLDVSRMRQDGIELRKRRIDLRATVQAALERVRPLAEAAKAHLHTSLPSTEVPIIGDPDRLEQVEVNLLGNAIKYSSSGDIHLTIELDGGRVKLSVRDHGMGIPPHMLERIFEPFVRALDEKDVHGPMASGMGLGLALVRSIVRAHGGDVVASSDGRGKGALFTVTLPLAGPEAGTGAAHHDKARTLVLAEDQQDSREMLSALLRHAGYDVHCAADGESAVELIAAVRPQVAVLDIGLPGISGKEVARRVRSQPGHDGLFLVALTGYGQQQDREEILGAGFDQHLVKPVDVETLLGVLRAQKPLRSQAAGKGGGG